MVAFLSQGAYLYIDPEVKNNIKERVQSCELSPKDYQEMLQTLGEPVLLHLDSSVKYQIDLRFVNQEISQEEYEETTSIK